MPILRIIGGPDELVAEDKMVLSMNDNHKVKMSLLSLKNKLDLDKKIDEYRFWHVDPVYTGRKPNFNVKPFAKDKTWAEQGFKKEMFLYVKEIDDDDPNIDDLPDWKTYAEKENLLGGGDAKPPPAPAPPAPTPAAVPEPAAPPAPTAPAPTTTTEQIPAAPASGGMPPPAPPVAASQAHQDASPPPGMAHSATNQFIPPPSADHSPALGQSQIQRLWEQQQRAIALGTPRAAGLPTPGPGMTPGLTPYAPYFGGVAQATPTPTEPFPGPPVNYYQPPPSNEPPGSPANFAEYEQLRAKAFNLEQQLRENESRHQRALEAELSLVKRTADAEAKAQNAELKATVAEQASHISTLEKRLQEEAEQRQQLMQKLEAAKASRLSSAIGGGAGRGSSMSVATAAPVSTLPAVAAAATPQIAAATNTDQQQQPTTEHQTHTTPLTSSSTAAVPVPASTPASASVPTTGEQPTLIDVVLQQKRESLAGMLALRKQSHAEAEKARLRSAMEQSRVEQQVLMEAHMNIVESTIQTAMTNSSNRMASIEHRLDSIAGGGGVGSPSSRTPSSSMSPQQNLNFYSSSQQPPPPQQYEYQNSHNNHHQHLAAAASRSQSLQHQHQQQPHYNNHPRIMGSTSSHYHNHNQHQQQQQLRGEDIGNVLKSIWGWSRQTCGHQSSFPFLYTVTTKVVLSSTLQVASSTTIGLYRSPSRIVFTAAAVVEPAAAGGSLCAIFNFFGPKVTMHCFEVTPAGRVTRTTTSSSFCVQV